MSESSTGKTSRHAVARVRTRVRVIRGWAERTLLWKVWDRMLETEFIDRSIALAGKAFISFFPLIIVVAAFMPSDIRTSIFTAVTHRLGLTGASLATAKQAFASSDDIRRATGLLGLVLAFFYASSFTTALHRAYLRAWRRPPSPGVGTYVRGAAWLAAILVYLALLGGVRGVLHGGAGIAAFVVAALALSTAMWWFTAWLMLTGQVRPRALFPSGLITAIAISAYGLSATLWMPGNVTGNAHQYGTFGVALALVAWFSGAAICVIVGACAGPVLAEDPGPIGRIIRNGAPSPLVKGALPALPPPVRSLRLADAFSPSDDDTPKNPNDPRIPPQGGHDTGE
jgi:membrane protein